MDNQTTQPTVTQSPLQQPVSQPSTSTKGKLKPLLLSLLALVIFAAVGYGVYSWQHKKVSDATTKVSSLQSQVSSLQSQVNKLSQATKTSSSSSTKSSDPTADWALFTSKDGKFSLKYPSSWVVTSGCPDNQFDAGPTSITAGSCTDVVPEITIGDTNHPCLPPTSGYNTQNVTVSGMSGKEYISTALNDIEYCIPSPTMSGLVFEASYNQQPGSTDVSADFNTVVTKTLTFK